MVDRVYVFGASGTGTTTLGAEIAKVRQIVHVDCDDHYWEKSDPSFTKKRAPNERIRSMRTELGEYGWVISGSCHGWCSELIDQSKLLVFISLPAEVRLSRLAQREKERFGARIETGGDMHLIHKDFLEWASEYENPLFTGRSRAGHENWLRDQSKPVCRIDGSQAIDVSVRQVTAHLD